MQTRLTDRISEGEATPTKRNRRGEATRRILLDAAVDCLQRLGYAGTSVETVMAASGISRGSVLHQFPTRLALMSAAVEDAMKAMMAASRLKFEGFTDPVQRFRAMFDIFWESEQGPEAVAVTEILLAARWDKALAEALRPVAEAIEVEIDRQVKEVAERAGARDIDACLVHARVLILSLRGITLELMYDPERAVIHRALEQLRQSHIQHCNEMLTKRF